MTVEKVVESYNKVQATFAVVNRAGKLPVTKHVQLLWDVCDEQQAVLSELLDLCKEQQAAIEGLKSMVGQQWSPGR